MPWDFRPEESDRELSWARSLVNLGADRKSQGRWAATGSRVRVSGAEVNDAPGSVAPSLLAVGNSRVNVAPIPTPSLWTAREPRISLAALAHE